MTILQRLTWEQFTQLCHSMNDAEKDYAVFKFIAQKGLLGKLFTNASATVTIGGSRYILSLTVDKET